MRVALSRGVAALGASCLAALAAAGPAPAAPVLDKGHGETVTAFADPEISEASGLVFLDGSFVTVNDSGHDAVLFTVDPSTGETIATTRFAASQTDVEALAPAGDNDVWVGDIGDNDGVRRGLSVTRVSVDGGSAGGTTYRLFYAHHARHDAEALLADPRSGRLLVVTKSFAGGLVYQSPQELDPASPNKLTRIGRVGGPITDGAFLPDGHHILLRDYARGTVYSFPELSLVGQFLLPLQPQGEALAVGADGSVYLTSEGPHQPVLRVQLPHYLQTALAAEPSDPAPDPAAAAAAATSTPSRFTPVFVVVGGAGLVALGGLIAVARRRTPARTRP